MLKESSAGDSYYDYICIIDFEATCEEGNPAEFLHEIIEFPVVLLNTHTLEIVSELLHLHLSFSGNYSSVH
jgi:3'-5' exoribonuclease 1